MSFYYIHRENPQRELYQANKVMLNAHEWEDLLIKKGRREGKGRKKNYMSKLRQPQDTTGSNLHADTLNRPYESVYSIHDYSWKKMCYQV